MKKLIKVIFILVIIGATVYSIYYVGKKGVDMFRAAKANEKLELAKKRSILKDQQNKALAEKAATAVPEKDEFTFFETLSDPEMNKIVGLNNNIQAQPVVPPRPPESKAARKPVVVVANDKPNPPEAAQQVSLLLPTGTEDSKTAPKPAEAKPLEAKPLEAKPSDAKPVEAKPPVAKALDSKSSEAKPVPKEPGKDSVNKQTAPVGKQSSPQLSKPVADTGKSEKDDDRTYTVQISSHKDLASAQGMQAKLQKQGHSAYMVSVDTPGKGVIYRVFLGKYIGKNKAKAAAEKAKRDDNVNGVIILLQD